MAPRSLPANPLRAVVFYAALIITALILIVRLAQLQILQNDEYARQAEENRLTRVNDPAPRGVIYDHNLVPLAINVPSYNVVMTPADLPDEDAEAARREDIFRRLADLLDMPLTVPGSTPQRPCASGRGIVDLVNEFKNFRPFEPFKLKCDIPKELALLIREELPGLPGVGITVEPLRQYPTGELTAGLTGYMAPIPDPNESAYFRQLYDYYTGRGLLPGRDRVGVAGLEASMQDELAGLNGQRLIAEDVGGFELGVVRVETETVPGLNLQVTIDVRLQAAAESAIQRRVQLANSYYPDLPGRQLHNGVAIVMNPNTGEILAMVSWPSFDNNRFARNIDVEYYEQLSTDRFYPLLNHAVNILYPPGSVFKVVTAVGATEDGVIDPEREIVDKGLITIQDEFIPGVQGRSRDFVCWNRAGHGQVSLVRGIAESCNVYFYKIGGGWAEEGVDGLGLERLGEWMNRFGFGQPTGVELPGELGGFIPTRKWKRLTWSESWSTGDTYNAVIGQGYVHVTPLQMLNAYNAVINGGTLYRPTLIDKFLDGEGNVITDTTPDALGQVPISASTLDYVRRGLRQAVTDGTLFGTFSLYGEIERPVLDVPEELNVAGKTGTAEYCDAIAYPLGLCIPGAFPTHSWTMLYAPYDNPEVSVIVFMYNGGEGSRNAAPVAGEILRAYFELKEADALRNAPPVEETP
jgi:penicillin-binding protein 2